MTGAFFRTTRRRDDVLVEWRFDLAQDKEVYRWFRERGHIGRFIDGMRSRGRYVKCSKEIAVMAKLTWGGAIGKSGSRPGTIWLAAAILYACPKPPTPYCSS